MTNKIVPMSVMNMFRVVCLVIEVLEELLVIRHCKPLTTLRMFHRSRESQIRVEQEMLITVIMGVMIRERGESERVHVWDDHRHDHSTISEVKGRLSHSLTAVFARPHCLFTCYLRSPATRPARRGGGVRELTVTFEEIGIWLWFMTAVTSPVRELELGIVSSPAYI